MKKSKGMKMGGMSNPAPSRLLGPGPGTGKALRGTMDKGAYPSRETPSGKAPKGMKIQRMGE